ncbi:MAG: Phosphoribosyltransferase [Pseudonocardiales bacterium]|nr:Phosphoribosyltransferase [Pseudonocardiales bacterium]
MARAGRGPRTFADRVEAGRALAAQLGGYAGRDDVLVLGLPRGGVPVAGEIAAVLDVPLDVLVVRKLGVPKQAELAMGAIAGVAGGVELIRNLGVLRRSRVTEDDFDEVYRREVAELRRRERAYRDGRPAAPIRGHTVVLVDDGLATGSTMRAAAAAARGQGPARLVVAVPVAAAATCHALRREVDDVICIWTPEPFYAVGQAYRDFAPTSDDEVRRVLAGAPRRE